MNKEELKNFYNFYKKNLKGKTFCEKKKEAKYREKTTVDHLGYPSGSTLIPDGYEEKTKKTKITKKNAMICVKKVLDGKGQIK